ncbi:hypothetical protein TVAG_172160 [Trichomonas vaginalis G3]|uniref:Uncharacterized protein n=1 Tax=Trichomonas vaginalis (strain ATCC PRA-98 / G3) TaxID=412133 RepID=A2DEW7_TRIV3|nr:Ankyrin repeat family [Trichomonas vaginalis G3]EAY20959.1 hypothetical protein TVAG_172160 [Trichomonas vaginalis G3]KAI5519119.1 Ankyrin repeat family [Trichomonas vaginalis G3]|eukprot:XP_001581945.1 hypothetical protein [Trichomonas vaginalis G3]
MAQILIKDREGRTALHNAAIQGNKRVADFLISHGALINETENHGKTALNLALEYKREEIVELLRSHNSTNNS